MATKKLKDIEVSLIGCSEPASLTASDTATDPIATYALDEFKAEKQMDFKNGDTTYYVPFHAVDHIVVNETEESTADRPDPYGCESEGGGDEGEVWFTGTVDTSQKCIGSSREVSLSPTAKADLNAFKANLEGYSISINNMVLPYFHDLGEGDVVGGTWNDSETDEFGGTRLFVIEAALEGDYFVSLAGIPCDWTDGTIVEVTVAHK